MKRFLLVLFILSVLALTVTLVLRGRTPEATRRAAEDILRLAAQRSRSTGPFRFSLTGRFSVTGGTFPSSGTVTVQGTIQDAGQTIGLTLTTDTLIAPGSAAGKTYRLRGEGESVLLREKETYFRLRSLSVEPGSDLLRPELLALLMDKWWIFPAPAISARAAVPGGVMTPSPSVLQAQSQVVRIEEDLGVTQLGDRSVYHERVVLDPEKLIAFLQEVARERGTPLDAGRIRSSLTGASARGEMWIDAETFALRRVTWDIENFRMQESVLSGSFTVDLSDENAVAPVEIPRDAQLLTPATIFGATGPADIPGISIPPEQSSVAPSR